MSILETPRILFRGNIAWDPITTNNYSQLYDEDSAENIPASTTQAQVAAFRTTAVSAIASSGNWNPHGTHRATFYDVEVTGVDRGQGVDTSDLFVGSPVNFQGMLVDCEPYGSVSSQLFFDAMQFGIPGACQVGATRTSRMMARYVNFTRNSYNRIIAGVASVVWQTSFAKGGLALDPHGSGVLGDLAAAMADDNVLGLTVRWNSYRTIYYDDPSLRNGSPSYVAAANAHMAAITADGGFQPNPARSVLVGVLGLWRRGEPMLEPGDRALLSVPPGEIVATAHARLSGNRLTIDLANSITEIDELLGKQNLGPLSVVAIDPASGTETLLGTLAYHQYDRTAYEVGSGIVVLPFDDRCADAARTGNLEVRAGDGSVYLQEDPVRALPTEQNRYFNQNDPQTDTILQVYDRGAPAAAGVEVAMYHMLTDGNSVPTVQVGSATTGPDGTAAMPIAPAAGGGSVQAFVFTTGTGTPPPPQLDPQLTPYMTIRTLPADDAVGALPATWDNVYAHVLANWNAMAPCMDNWLRLDDPAQVHAYGAMLRKLTDPANFEAFRFMPVTRDMTVGERNLLWNFLNGPAPTKPAGLTTEAAASPAAPAARDLTKLSRSMRGG